MMTPVTQTIEMLDVLLHGSEQNITVQRNDLLTMRDLLTVSRTCRTLMNNNHLTPKELRLYAELRGAQGEIVPMQRLMDAAEIGTPQALWVHIRRLREKLDGEAHAIHTVNKQGYMLRRGEGA